METSVSALPGVLVIGLGRVGLVSAAVLADAGLRVRAVERDPHRRAQIARGRAPFPEPGLAPLLARLLAADRLEVEEEPRSLADIDVVLLCVGTPPARDGGFDLTALTGALRGLGRGLRAAARSRPLLVAVRATVLPGTCETVLIPALAEAAGTPPGNVWELVHLPEFLREGRALEDVRHPARLVVGERLPGAARGLYGLFDPLGLVPRAVPLRLAELLKLADNAWHATKVAFANELGRLARACGVEPAELADLFLADRRLNLGPAYLRPGEPFGGPCLPKDLGALRHHGRRLGLELPLLEGVAASNARHLDWLVAVLGAHVPPPGPVLLFGLAFKPATGDVRGSPDRKSVV